MQHRVLPIKIPTDLSATFFYALPAACICGDPDYDDWYHMNYLDFYGYKNTVNSAKYEFRFVDAVSYIDRGVHLNEAIELDRYDLTHFSCIDLISFLREQIDSWTYVILFVDESKIPNSPFSETGHEYLVYGYDDHTQELYLLGMDQKRQYETMKLPYAIVHNAFDSLIRNYTQGKRLYQLCVTNRYSSLANGENYCFSHHIVREYKEEIFVHKIRTYLDAKITEGSLRVINEQINPKIACGVDTADVLYLYLSEVESGKNQFEFNVPFFFLDHKRCVYNRILYAHEKTQRNSYRYIADAYRDVVQMFEQFKNVHMKRQFQNNLDMQYLKDLLERIVETERQVLAQI